MWAVPFIGLSSEAFPPTAEPGSFFAITGHMSRREYRGLLCRLEDCHSPADNVYCTIYATPFCQDPRAEDAICPQPEAPYRLRLLAPVRQALRLREAWPRKEWDAVSASLLLGTLPSHVLLQQHRFQCERLGDSYP